MSMYKRLKKNTKWTILNLGNFNIDNIIKEVKNYSNEWLIDTSRQEMGSVHKETQMYRICATDYEWEPGTSVETIQYNSLHSEQAKNELNNIFNELENYYSGKVIRCEIIKMKPYSDIGKHTDGGPILHYSRRVHIPLITHEEIMFCVMGNCINMKQGGWYEINNQLPHSVNNPTETNRIHMIIDILPDDMLTLRNKNDYK